MSKMGSGPQPEGGGPDEGDDDGGTSREATD